ncbi:MAG: hypothetical protein HOH58_08270 [Opitutaceae bacterium]|jgi:predicted deacylase|nr:hypothetical protein [Opitutaceae bacterium]
MTDDPSASSPLAGTTLPVGRLQHRFGNTDLGFDAWIWRSDQPGPALVINGATHGDEYEGPTLLRQWVETWQPVDLCGTVVIVPVLNEAAFAAKQRCHPIDGENLARAFPGAPEGAPTSRLAHLFETQVLAHATHYVDLHSGGQALELHPWVGYIVGGGADIDATQRAMAACFDSFWCWAGPYLPGRTLSAAFHRKVAAIYTECRGAGEVLPADLADLDQGLQNLLIELSCVAGAQPPLAVQSFHQSTDAEETHLQAHHPAPHAGTFESIVALRDVVEAGATLGIVRPILDQPPTPIFAETSGTVVLRRHECVVQPGDALFVIVPL